MRDALLGHNDPEIAEWAHTKGMDNGARELRRIYDRALTAGVISTQAPYDTARAFQRGLAVPLRHHRGDFFEWNWLRLVWKSKKPAYAQGSTPSSTNAKRRNRRRQASAGETQYQDGWRGVRRIARRGTARRIRIEPPAWLEGEHLPPAHTLVACANRRHAPAEQNTPAAHGVIFNHNALDFDYEPFAPEPRQWLDFLNQLWGDDQQAIDTLQEIFGFCLDRRHEPAKSVRSDRPETQRQGHHRSDPRRDAGGPQIAPRRHWLGSAPTSGSRR